MRRGRFITERVYERGTISGYACLVLLLCVTTIGAVRHVGGSAQFQFDRTAIEICAAGEGSCGGSSELFLINTPPGSPFGTSPSDEHNKQYASRFPYPGPSAIQGGGTEGVGLPHPTTGPGGEAIDLEVSFSEGLSESGHSPHPGNNSGSGANPLNG